MKKKNEKLGKLLEDLNSVLGDTNKSTEIFYLLKKHGASSEGQRKEIIELGKQIVKNQQFTKTYADKYLELLSYLKQQGELSQLQQSDLVDLEKDLLDKQNDVEKNLLKLTEIARGLKIQLPKTFDVSIKNTDDFPTEFRISNLDEIPKPSDEINIKQPAWLPNFFEAAFRFIVQPLITVIKKQLQNVNITGPTDPKKAIAVRLSDGNRFYTAILQAVSAAGSNSQKVEDLLQEVVNNTDTLELKADQVNLNTDTLEDKLQTLIDGNKWQRNVFAGKAYVVTTNVVIVSGTSEVAFFLLKNPNSSGKTIKIKKILLGLENIASISTCRIYRDPTITTNGTALTPVNLLKGSAASVLTCFRSPTISANGTLMIADPVSGISDHEQDLGLLISPNENLLLTLDPTNNNTPHMITVYYMEE